MDKSWRKKIMNKMENSASANIPAPLHKNNYVREVNIPWKDVALSGVQTQNLWISDYQKKVLPTETARRKIFLNPVRVISSIATILIIQDLSAGWMDKSWRKKRMNNMENSASANIPAPTLSNSNKGLYKSCLQFNISHLIGLLFPPILGLEWQDLKLQKVCMDISSPSEHVPLTLRPHSSHVSVSLG